MSVVPPSKYDDTRSSRNRVGTRRQASFSSANSQPTATPLAAEQESGNRRHLHYRPCAPVRAAASSYLRGLRIPVQTHAILHREPRRGAEAPAPSTAWPVGRGAWLSPPPCPYCQR